MNPRKQLPSLEYLNECFCYDPGKGTLTWRERPTHHFSRAADQLTWNKTWAGRIAGNAYGRCGHLQVMISAQNYLAHRIVWKIQTGNEPPDHIDHINLNGGDNKWTNLRAATHSQNHANAHIRKNNRSGFNGVSESRWGNGFKAEIRQNNQTKYLGRFDTAEAAHAAYCKAAQELFGEFWRSA